MHSRTRFTLAEYIVILDAVLKHVNEQSPENLNLPASESQKIGAQLGRHRTSPRKRWDILLKPWILKHNSGTLNLDIRRQLANFLAKNFKDLSSIDWQLVSRRPEFSGHTETSLRYFFSNYLLRLTKDKLSKRCEELTLDMIAEVANSSYLPDARGKGMLKRQKEIINYFERYVERNCINKG